MTHNITSKSVSAIPLNGVNKKRHSSTREMLAENSSVRDVRLGKITDTEHRINLKEEIHTIRQNLYRSGHKERKFARGNIEKMPKLGDIES